MEKKVVFFKGCNVSNIEAGYFIIAGTNQHHKFGTLYKLESVNGQENIEGVRKSEILF